MLESTEYYLGHNLYIHGHFYCWMNRLCSVLFGGVFLLQVKWMMYWIVFALFTCAETFADIFVSWLLLRFIFSLVEFNANHVFTNEEVR